MQRRLFHLREVELDRRTTETEIKVRLNIDGQGKAEIDTGCQFFNHLLGALAKHGLFDLKAKAQSTMSVDPHHAVEDVAIVLGKALDSATQEKIGIKRFGSAIIPMDDSLVLVAVDFGGRGYAKVNVTFNRSRIGDLDVDLIAHFLQTLAINGNFTLHVNEFYGQNDHHKAEAIFKALGVALNMATRIEPRSKGIVPSQKGVIG
jgi:imidazoleglycerol-phosphate dehydratase